jgi:hypothetical protein
MPSASFTLILCFVTFICGQLFNTFCTSLHPIKIESIASVVPVDTGFSFKTVIVIVFSALVVHDAVILLVIRHLPKDSKRTLRVLKTLPAAAADHISIPQGPLLILPVNTLLVPHKSFRLRPTVVSIPRPFWIWRFLYRPPTIGFSSRAVLPLLEYLTTLALVAKRVSSPLPCALLTGGHPCIQDLPLFMRLFSPLAAAAVPRYPLTGVGLQGVWGTNVKEELEEDSEDTTLYLESNSSLKDKEIKASADEGIKTTLEETIEDSPAEDGPGRQSHVPVLRHLTAAALLRKSQVRVNDEPCYASIEEVIEDEEVVEESVEEFRSSRPARWTSRRSRMGRRRPSSTPFLMGSARRRRSSGSFPPNTSPSSRYTKSWTACLLMKNLYKMRPLSPYSTQVSLLFLLMVRQLLFLYFPSLTISTHAAVHRPPPLSLFASRVDVKSTSVHPRVSHLHLLARLSSRMSALIVESA